MSSHPAPDLRKSRRPVSGGQTLAPADLADLDSGRQPPIWVDGRQAPRFDAQAYARAGMLLARESASLGLIGVAAQTMARAATVAGQDWSPFVLRMGRAGPYLPRPAAVARLLRGFALRSTAARAVLYGLPANLPFTPDAPDPSPTRVQPQRPTRRAALAEVPPPEAPPPQAPTSEAPPPQALASEAPTSQAPASDQAAPSPLHAAAPQTVLPDPSLTFTDPDIDAIRALLRMTPDEPLPPSAPQAAHQTGPETGPQTGPQTAQPAKLPRPRRRRRPLTLPRFVRRVLDWTTIRVMAGTALAFATPIGYGRALYLHLDGATLTEIVADLSRRPGLRAPFAGPQNRRS